jgi:hypothetical protein
MNHKTTVLLYVPLLLPQFLILDTWHHISNLPKTHLMEQVNLYQHGASQRDALIPHACLISHFVHEATCNGKK